MSEPPRQPSPANPDPARSTLGGVIHAYLGYDPVNFPPPRSAPPDIAGAAFEHMLHHGSLRRLTPEELARAVTIDPSQIKGFGPSIESLLALLEERRAKILATWESDSVRRRADEAFRTLAASMTPPPKLASRFEREVREGQLRDLERLWYEVDEQSPFARQLVHLVERLGDRFQVEALASRWVFTGRAPLSIEEALRLKEELETIERLIEQLREALKHARIALIDLEALEQFAPPEEIEGLRDIERRVQEMIEQLAHAQGIERSAQGWSLTPRAMRLYQTRLLQEIFNGLSAGRSGRHEGVQALEGEVELPTTRPWNFGDPLSGLDAAESITNALLRRAADAAGAPGADASEAPLTLTPEDLRIFKSRRTPRCATAVILDMSGSMRYGGQYVSCKRMALALDGLIRREYPGDSLFFVEMYTLAKPVRSADLASLMPKPVSISRPVVRLRADLADPRLGEMDLPLHFTNIQRALQLSRHFLAAQPTPNRQIILLTDGLPTAHMEGSNLFMLYPPDPRTEAATMREAQMCRRDGITLNVMLLPSWSQDEDDVGFAYRIAESTGGRVFFTGGRELDRFVVWDYLTRRRTIIG
ncbi:MAG: hypothetical protein KF724_09415 [Phycisphaeraceae bacterium]|nr:hypothetical protein [Phycisphaeraceae bacterium]